MASNRRVTRSMMSKATEAPLKKDDADTAMSFNSAVKNIIKLETPSPVPSGNPLMPAFARLKTELPLTPNFPLQQKRKRLSPPPPRSIKQENDSEPARPERYNGNRYNNYDDLHFLAARWRGKYHTIEGARRLKQVQFEVDHPEIRILPPWRAWMKRDVDGYLIRHRSTDYVRAQHAALALVWEELNPAVMKEEQDDLDLKFVKKEDVIKLERAEEQKEESLRIKQEVRE